MSKTIRFVGSGLVVAALVVGFFITFRSFTLSALAASENITQIVFTNPEREVWVGDAAAMSVQTRNASGTSEQVGEATTIILQSSSITGEFASGPSCGTWGATSLTIGAGNANRNLCYRDSVPGTYTITVSASGTTWAAATQTVTVKAVSNSEGEHYSSIQAAITGTDAGGTVNIPAGTYETTGQVLIDKNLSIVGVGGKPVIRPNTDMANTNAASAWFLVTSDTTFSLSNVVLDGGTFYVWQGIRSHGNTTISNVDFKNIQGSLTGSPYRGFAVLNFGGTVPGGVGSDSHSIGGSTSTLIVTNSTFEQIGRVGVLVKGTASMATISGNTYTGKGDGDFLDYGFEAGAGGHMTVTGNTISNNRGVASDNSTSAGVLVTDYYGAGTNAIINGNTFTNNSAGLHVGYNASDASIASAHQNQFIGNGKGVVSSNPSVDATLNWWGSGNPDFNSVVSTNVNYSPWCGDSACVTQREFNVFIDVNGNSAKDDGEATYFNLSSAIASATSGDAILILPGTYTESGQIVIDKNLSIVGFNKNSVVIKPSDDMVYDSNWITVLDGVSLNLSGVTLDGQEKDVFYGIRLFGGATINNNIIKNIIFPGYEGIAIRIAQESTTTRAINITNNEFSGYGRIAIHVNKGTEPQTVTISGNTFIGKGTGDHLDYGVEVERGGHADVLNNTFTGHKGVAVSDGSTSAAMLITTYFATGTSATVTGNTFSDNTNAIAIGYLADDTSTVVAHQNKFISSTGKQIESSNSGNPVNAELNWWGNFAPDFASLVSTTSTIDFTPWCVNESCSASAASVAILPALNGIDLGLPEGATSTSTPSAIVLGNSTVLAGNNEIAMDNGTLITAATNFNLDDLAVQTISNPESVSSWDLLATRMALIQFGIPGTTLTFNPAITVRMHMPGKAGQELAIRRSSDGISWTTDGLSSATCVVTALPDEFCEVGTTKASYFLVTNVPPPPGSGSSSGGGGSVTVPAVPAVPAAPTVGNVIVGTPAIPAAPQVLGASTFNFSFNFSIGSRGEHVLALQTFLRAQGLYNGLLNGYFGPITRASVMAYQRANGIYVSGVVGPVTRARLNSSNVAGASLNASQIQAEINRLQTLLQALLLQLQNR